MISIKVTKSKQFYRKRIKAPFKQKNKKKNPKHVNKLNELFVFVFVFYFFANVLVVSNQNDSHLIRPFFTSASAIANYTWKSLAI